MLLQIDLRDAEEKKNPNGITEECTHIKYYTKKKLTKMTHKSMRMFVCKRRCMYV